MLSCWLFGFIRGNPGENGDRGSVFALFGITREILRQKGRDCIEFTKVAVVVLNQIVRPFTAKWHRRSLERVRHFCV